MADFYPPLGRLSKRRRNEGDDQFERPLDRPSKYRREFFRVAHTLGESKLFELSSSIYHELYKHQKEGLKWLWKRHCESSGAILADDMGLGKTRLVATFLAGLFESKFVRMVLIIVPKNLISGWEKELNLQELGLRNVKTIDA